MERVTRTASTLISDELDRFPFVRQRHTVFDLTPDAKLSGMVMDVRTPSGATHGALTVPQVSMMYSAIELEVATSLAHATDAARTPDGGIVFRQFYPDRNFGPSVVLHSGTVYPRGKDSVELRHDWLVGSGDITVDSSRRMLTHSGMRSTYKVSGRRTTELPDVAAIVVDYGRPLARGRTLLGTVIELDRVWRTVPHAHRPQLIVNNHSCQRGTQYDSAHDVGTMLIQTDSTSALVEQFTIRVLSRDRTHGTLTIDWGQFRWLMPLAVR